MKLNHDCIRAILCHIESTTNITVNEDGIDIDFIAIEDFYENLPSFEKADIFYSLSILDDAGFIDVKSSGGNDCVYEYYVRRMTYEGHEYLDGIRDEQRWTMVKKGLSKIGSASLSVVSAIAEGVTAAAIDKYLKSTLST